MRVMVESPSTRTLPFGNVRIGHNPFPSVLPGFILLEQLNPMPTYTPVRTLTSSLIRGAALLLGVVAGFSFLWGGRALQEFANFDRMFGEAVGLVFALVLGMIAVFLKALAERIEDHDDGELVSLAIGDVKEHEKTEIKSDTSQSS